MPAEAGSAGAAITDAHRVCPVLAGPALIDGTSLTVRVGAVEHQVSASAAFLRAVFEWCTGEATLEEIARGAEAAGLGAFDRFLAALLEAGILVDGAQWIEAQLAALGHPGAWGRAEPAARWPALQRKLPAELPAGAKALPSEPAGALGRLLALRRSAAAFGAASVAPSKLAAVLQSAYGVAAAPPAARRTVPSAGGFYRLDLRVVLVREVGGLEPGVYVVHYSRDGGVGLQWVSGDVMLAPRALQQPDRMRHAAGLLLVSCCLGEVALKYRNRALVHAVTEAGALLQNAALACAEQQLGWRTIGGWDEIPLRSLCGLSAEETPLAMALFGSLPSEAEVAGAAEETPFDLSWSPSDQLGLPFFVAHARAGRASGPGGQGWGRDRQPAAAADKALAEAAERLAYRMPRECRRANAWELDRWLHPHALVRYSPTQLARRGFPFGEFREDEPRWWLQVRQVGGDEQAWVPAEFVLHPSALPQPGGGRWLFRANSSGCASHTTVCNAVEGGLWELLERDAFMRHWLAQVPGCDIDVRTLPGELGARAAALRGLGCDVRVLWLQGGLVPVWLVFVQSHARAFTAVAGGCGDAAAAALARALDEAETAARVRLAAADADAAPTPRDVATPRQHAALYASARHYRRADLLVRGGGRAVFEEVEHSWPASFDAALHLLRQAGHPAAWFIDLSLPGAPCTLAGASLKTVRVLVPGLVPLTFGRDALPLGMVPLVHPRALFPHPFP